ncbi:MAG TPA: metal ABC transporter ATP-binding protein [Anaerolineaceae bacterium]|nr:metal ABC transporter ATP-binding protein [Anaerolineaceae bacterium]
MSLLKEIRKTNRYLRSHFSEHQPDEPILRVSGLTVRYESGYALRDVTFALKTGERMAVVGPNGAGKSTLFKVIAGVMEPSEGEVQIRGDEPGGHVCIAYVPQRSAVDWNFPATVFDTIMMGRTGKIGLFRFPTARDRAIVREALAVVGLSELADRQISQLSGGQQQRMFIARALAQEAELMLMDEPLTGLDATAQADIFTILETLRRQGVTVMIALHDLDIAARRFDRVMLLNRRLIGVGAPEETFTTERLVEAYGGRMRLIPGGQGLVALDDTCCGEGGHTHD